MSNCEALSSHDHTPPLITKRNLFELIPDTYDVRPGTQVAISCAPSLQLVGEQSLKCLANGQWSYTTKPYCKEFDTDEDDAWYDTTWKLIIVCVIWGAVVLVVLSVLIKIIAILVRKERHDKRNHHRAKYVQHGHEHGNANRFGGHVEGYQQYGYNHARNRHGYNHDNGAYGHFDQIPEHDQDGLDLHKHDHHKDDHHKHDDNKHDHHKNDHRKLDHHDHENHKHDDHKHDHHNHTAHKHDHHKHDDHKHKEHKHDHYKHDQFRHANDNDRDDNREDNNYYMAGHYESVAYNTTPSRLEDIHLSEAYSERNGNSHHSRHEDKYDGHGEDHHHGDSKHHHGDNKHKHGDNKHHHGDNKHKHGDNKHRHGDNKHKHDRHREDHTHEHDKRKYGYYDNRFEQLEGIDDNASVPGFDFRLEHTAVTRL